MGLSTAQICPEGVHMPTRTTSKASETVKDDRSPSTRGATKTAAAAAAATKTAHEGAADEDRREGRREGEP